MLMSSMLFFFEQKTAYEMRSSDWSSDVCSSDLKLTELDFINQRQKSPGEFTPPNTSVLHLYGRYCNANKFACEVDLFEALESVKKLYPIDDNRLVDRKSFV